MRLFTKEIDKKLFEQYPLGSDLAKQKVVAKIFNPFSQGRWYLLNSDPNDSDYIWAIVQMGDVVEMGSVSRKDLESVRLTAYKLPLERDLHFTPTNAKEVWDGLHHGKFFSAGGALDKKKNACEGMGEQEVIDLANTIKETGTPQIVDYDDAKKIIEDQYAEEHRVDYKEEYPEGTKRVGDFWIVKKDNGDFAILLREGQQAHTCKTEKEAIDWIDSKYMEEGGTVEKPAKEVRFHSAYDGEVKAFKSTQQEDLYFYVVPEDKSYRVVAEVKGFPATEACDDWFGDRETATKIAKLLAEGKDIENVYAAGGSVKEPKLTNIRKNIMGTTSFDLQIEGMRKPQDFVVYPISKEDAANKNILIQSDKRIGQLNLETGKGIMSENYPNGAYFIHLQIGKKIPFELSQQELTELRNFIIGTSGEKVGSRNILSDNSGAGLMRHGGKVKSEEFEAVKNDNWRFTKAGAEKLGLKENDVPTLTQIAEYHGKRFIHGGAEHRYIERGKMAKGGVLKNGKEHYEKGDEGMYKGGEARVLKYEDGVYTVAYLDGEGDVAILEEIMRVPEKDFEEAFAYFPKDEGKLFEVGGGVGSWEKQKEWYGNPSMGLDSYKKVFVNPFNGRKVPVFIFGKDDSWNFVVSAGANSDYSYTGGFPETVKTLEERMNYVDEKYKNKKLIYKEGGVTGDVHDLTDELLSQKIQIFLGKIKPYKYEYVDEDTQSLVVGFDTELTTDRAGEIMNMAQSSREFFDADQAEFITKDGESTLIVPLKSLVMFEEGGKVKKVATENGYEYYIGKDEGGKVFYNIIPEGRPAPDGGYHSKDYILKMKGVPDRFEEGGEVKDAVLTQQLIDEGKTQPVYNGDGIIVGYEALPKSSTDKAENFIEKNPEVLMEGGGEITGEFKPARYAKGKIAYHPPKSDDGWKNREMRLAEAKTVNGKWSHREKAYIMSVGAAERLKKYIKEGYDAEFIGNDLIKPEDVMAEGGKVKFKDKVKAIKKSLVGKKVPKKYQKKEGKVFTEKTAAEAATKIAGKITAVERIAKRKTKKLFKKLSPAQKLKFKH